MANNPNPSKLGAQDSKALILPSILEGFHPTFLPYLPRGKLTLEPQNLLRPGGSKRIFLCLDTYDVASLRWRTL